MIEKVLVTVMTYPALSDKHFETVCTAGLIVYYLEAMIVNAIINGNG